MMMSHIFVVFSALAVILTSSYDAQATQTNVCRVYNNGSALPVAPNPQTRSITLRSVLSLICDNEKLITTRSAVDVVVLIGRTGTGKSYLADVLADVKHGQGVKLTGEVAEQNGTSSTQSNTFVPVWFYNNKTNTLFLDSPGFEDTRGADYDIADAHFNQLLLNKVQRVKIVLVEQHLNLIENGERNALPTLLRHTVRLVKDIGKFNHSVALAASKVESAKSDKDVVQQMVNFLEKARQHRHNDTDEFKLLDILLERNSSSRIGFLRFVRNPTKDDSVVQQNKKRMDEIVNNLQFTDVRDGDFGYTISDNSILGVNRLADEIASAVNGNVASLSRSVGDHYNKLSKVDASTKTLAELVNASSYLLDFKQQLEKSDNLDAFLERTVPQMEHEFKVTFSPAVIANIGEYREYWTFLREVSGNETKLKMWSTDFATDELKSLNALQGSTVERLIHPASKSLASNCQLLASALASVYLAFVT